MKTKKLFKNLRHWLSGMLCLVMLLGCTTSVWANTDRIVYFAPESSWVGSYTIKVFFQRGNGDTGLSTMTKTTDTYAGRSIYKATVDEKYGGLDKLYFQCFDGSTWKKEAKAFDSWWGQDGFANKIYPTTSDYGSFVDHNKDRLHGDFGSGWKDYTFENGSVTITLSASTTYEFGVRYPKDSDWKGQTGNSSMTRSNNSWTLDGGNNVKLDADVAGSYTFSITGESGNPKLTVTYPTITYTAKAQVGSVAGGKVTLDSETESTSSVSKTVASGTTVAFKATASSGYNFKGWGTSASATTYESTSNPYNVTITAATTLYAIFEPAAPANLYIRGPIYDDGCWPNDWHQLTPGANNTYSITFNPNGNYCQHGPKEFLISTSESDNNRLQTSYFSGRMTGCQASSRGSEGTYNFESTLSYLNTDELTITVTWNSTNNYSIAVTRNIQAPTDLYIKGPLLTWGWYDYTNSITGLTYTHSGNTYTFKFNANNGSEYGEDRHFCISTSTSDAGKINLTTTGSGSGWSYLDGTIGKNFVASSDIVTESSTPITITLTYNTETGLFDMALAKDCSTPPTAGTITPDPASVCSGSTSVLTLSGSTGTSFQWYKGSDLISGATSDSYTTEALTTATSYKVLVKDANNCSAETEPVTVTITTPALAPSASANDVDYYTGPLNVDFGPESNTKDIYLKSNSTCVNAVTWSCDKNDGWEFNGSSASSQDPVITFSKAGTYVFTVKDANNPSLSASVTINMNIPAMDLYFGGPLMGEDWSAVCTKNKLDYYGWDDNDKSNIYYILFDANVTLSPYPTQQERLLKGCYKYPDKTAVDIFSGTPTDYEFGSNGFAAYNSKHNAIKATDAMGLVTGSKVKLEVRYYGGRHFKYTLVYDGCTKPESVAATATYTGTVFSDNNRSASLSCTTNGFAYYKWECTDTDGREANVTISYDGLAQNCTATFNLPGTYHFKVKVGCGTISSVYRESGEMTVTTPYPEMRAVGPLFNGWTCTFTDDKIDGQMERNGLTWTKELVVNQSDQPFAIVQRYKNNIGKCDNDNDNSAGWTHWDEAGTDKAANKLCPSATSGRETGVTRAGNNFTQSLGANYDHVKLTVTMNAWNNYSVTLERMYKVKVAVKSWGNDNNTAEDMQNWWDLINYEGSFTKIGIINDTTDYRLANQGFTATARPYIADGEHRSVFLGWSTTPDSWDGSKFRDVTMITPINETYTKSSVDGDIELYAHFAFISTDDVTVNCNNVVVKASANSYADNINLKNAPYNYTSSIGYKIGESGEVEKVVTTGSLITTWATGIGEDPIEGHQRSDWHPVTGTLTGLTQGQAYKCQHILTKSTTDYYAYIWKDFTTLTAPAVSASPDNTTAYEVITLTSTSGSVTWSKSDAAAYFVQDQKAVDSDTVDAVSVNFKAPAKNTDYTVTAEDSNGCTSNLNITISEPQETCN